MRPTQLKNYAALPEVQQKQQRLSPQVALLLAGLWEEAESLVVESHFARCPWCGTVVEVGRPLHTSGCHFGRMVEYLQRMQAFGEAGNTGSIRLFSNN